MIERMGRCSRLAKMSLFIPGEGSERLDGLQKALYFRVTARGAGIRE
jgi:hypothetical protein